MGKYTTLTSSALLLARNKFSCLQVLAANGVGVPKTLLPTSNTMAYHSLDHLKGPPYIIKMARGTHGMGVLKANNKADAVHLLDSLHELKGMVVLQEYIRESSGRDVRIIVVGDEVVATMERKSEGDDFRSNLHLGGSSRVIQISQEEEKTAIRAVKLMGLEVAGVDILQSNRGPLVLEVNASPGLEGIEKTTGVDISSKIIELVEKKLIPGGSAG
jgi:ribosomal protein S6--L-glutamate ligase